MDANDQRLTPNDRQLVAAELVPGIDRKYLRFQDLQRLQHAEFTTRRQVRGIFSGHHASPLRGQSIEFRDYREYVPGDDLHSLDWKVFGRSDKLYVKLFDHQADLTVHLLVDASASMAYRGEPPEGLSKYDQACFLAAAIAFVVTKQGDRVSLSMARQGNQAFHPPGRTMRHLGCLLYTLETTYPAQQANLTRAIDQLAQQARRQDILIVVSDLLEDRDTILRGVDSFRQRGGEVLIFQVLHDQELDLPPFEDGVFVDSETGDSVQVNLRDVRREYEAQMREFLRGWQMGCSARGLSHHLVRTSTHYYDVLANYLLRRSAVK